MPDFQPARYKMKYFPHLCRLVKYNQRILLDYIERIKAEPGLRSRCVLAYQAATFATRHNTDIFASQEIEQPFLELAELLPAPEDTAWEEGSVLHVATEVYNSGGHSRCIERWMQLMDKQKHSCYLIKQHAAVPEMLAQLVKESGGCLHQTDPALSMVKKAEELRAYASHFQYVVLHTHMNDPVALIAFGSEKFTRPVILFNHADHIFWLGAGIADYVADLAAYRHQEITLRGRGITRAGVLNIPTENKPFATMEQVQARQQLGISPQARIVFASGHPRKFDPVGTPDFADIICAILNREPGVQFFIAGASPKQKLWKKLPPEFRKQVTFTGRLNYKTEYPVYLSAADLVLDSMPVSGGTAVSDAVKARKPLLAIRGAFLSDFINNSEAGCKDMEELVTKALRILTDADYRTRVYQDIYEKWSQEVDCEAWKARCKAAYNALPEHHRIYPCTPAAPGEPISDVSLLTCMWTQPHGGLFKQLRKWFYSRNKETGTYTLCGIPLNNNRTENIIFGNDAVGIH